MGYRTDFSLTTDLDWAERDKLTDALSDVTGYDWDTNLEMYSVKWYDHEEHMRKVSAMFPDTFFELEGVGEEQGDHWREFYKGGKTYCVRPSVTWALYDESKLK